MERDEHSVRKILSRYLTRYGAPSREQSEAAVEDVWHRLKPEVERAQVALSLKSLKSKPALAWRFRLAAVAATGLLLFVSAALVRDFISTNAVQGVVSATDGEMVRVLGDRTQPVRVGDRVGTGEVLRSTGGGAVLTLKDTTRVEMRSQTEFSLEHAADGIRIRLRGGGIIVHAAKQLAGRLYVETRDVTVSVVGTVFLVNAQEEGSRVAVIEGEVRVQQGATSKNLLPGEQLTTNPLMETRPVKEEFAWSRNAETHVALLQQSAAAPTATAPKRLEFEVATLKRVYLGDGPRDITCRGIDGVWSAGFRSASAEAELTPQGRCVGISNLGNLIGLAYGGFPVRRISGSISPEELIDFESYQMEAKAEDPRAATKEQLRQMAQNLVIDRFKLKAHTEIRETQGYFLRAVDSGVKFKETSDDEEQVFGSGLRLQPPCYWCLKGKFSLRQFANILESFIVKDRPVVNGTGLGGVYEIGLMLYRIEPIRDGAGGPRGAGGNGVPIEFDPSLSKALEDQLGLRLERGRVPVEHLVVDHFERPTEN